MPFKLFMTAMGVVVAMLSITGLVIWARKRRSKRDRLEAKSDCPGLIWADQCDDESGDD